MFNLFGQKPHKNESANENAQQDTIVEDELGNPPSFDLFVDPEPPKSVQQMNSKESGIKAFLGRNYHSMGVNDGYEYHTQETLETGKRKIRSDFQFVIDQELDILNQKRLQMRTLLISVSKISEEAKQNMDLLIDELNSSLDTLKMQKELSVENEGWVMSAIHGYHQGFIQGLNGYISDEQLLNSSNLFTSKI